MAIDKSLSQYQQLVKKGKGNRRPGYRGDDWGGPSYGGSSSRSSGGGGGNGSHDRGGGQHRAAAQRAAPAPSPHRDDSAERAAQAAADALNAAREAEARESAREKAIQVAALTPKTIEPIRSAHVDTPTQIAEQKEIDLYGYQDAKARAPTTLIPKTVTYDRGIPHLEDKLIPTTVGQTLFDPRTSQNVLLDRGTGIGTTLKNVALGVLAPQLLAGTAFAKPYNLYRQYQTAKRFLPEGIKRSIRTAFKKPKIETEAGLTKKVVKSVRDRDDVSTPAQAVAEGKGLESGQKMLGLDQRQELTKRRNIVQGILEQGSYQGRALTNRQRNNLMNYIEQINKFLVPVSQGI